MMTDIYNPEIILMAAAFEPITLQEMERVKLMNRVDAKFLIPVKWLPLLLTDLLPHYRLLTVEANQLCAYETLYFDTAAFSLYHEHLRGRLNRYKVRQRKYVQSNLAFTEVKYKNNKGRTIKTRIRTAFSQGDFLDEESKQFIARNTPYDPASLQPVLWVEYTRLTLVNRISAERLTLDLNLTFRNAAQQQRYTQVVIAEVKQENLKNSVFLNLMKEYHLREGSLSKYCLGVISLYEAIRHNRFKAPLHQLHKISSLS